MSFPRYSEYKDSGVEWLGQVPAHWSTSKLKHAARFASGGTPNKATPEYWDGDVPWASSKDLKCDAISDTIDHITQQAVEDGAALVSPGHLLVVVRGMILAHTFPVTKALVPMAINQDLKAIRPTAAWNIDYFAALLRAASPETFRRLDEAGHGTKALRMETWLGMEIPAPPLPEQQAIADFLDRETAKIDALVAEQERLIELLKEKRQAVISHAVTKGLDPSVPMKDSGAEWIGLSPSSWQLSRLRLFFRPTKRQTTEPGLAMLSVYREYGVIPKDSRDDNINKTPEDTSSYQLVEPGDLVVNKMKAWQGSLGMSQHRGITSPDYVVFALTARGTSVHTPFMHFLLRSRALVSTYRGISNGIRPDQWRLEPDKFLDTPVLMPPVAEQRAIADTLHHQTSIYAGLEAEADRLITLLQERRAALISAAVTGQIDVRRSGA